MTRRIWARIDRASILRLVAHGALVSLALNIAALVSPIFFTQVYDRVLTTGSTATLIVLTGVALIAIALGAAFEQVRGAAFLKASVGLYADLEPHVYRASQQRALAGAQGRRGQAFDDLEMVRGAIGGPLPGAALDLLFAPLFLAALFLVHFYVGLFALVVMVVMAALTTVTQWAISASMQKAHEAQVAAGNLAESQLRVAEAAAAMGFVGESRSRWARSSREAVREQIRANSQASGLSAGARGVRSGAQILIITIAAALALSGDISPGAIIAASIILGRLLAPIDQLLGGWRQLAQTRIALDRLEALLASAPPPAESAAPVPRGRLTLDSVSAASPLGHPILRGVTLAIEPGEIVAVIGSVGAGKSTLLRCALGVWPYSNGSVRLDGVPLKEIDRDQIGKHLGFLPQNADLLPGSISENIRRFGPPDPDGVLEAAVAAGARDAIAQLPQGFDTDVGEAGASLSAGQRRRIALARALYGRPALICLDEPEAHLDRDGEAALGEALKAMKARGAAVLLAAHRPSVVAQSDRIAIIQDGRIVRLGPSAEILKALMPEAAAAAPAQSLRQVAP